MVLHVAAHLPWITDTSHYCQPFSKTYHSGLDLNVFFLSPRQPLVSIHVHMVWKSTCRDLKPAWLLVHDREHDFFVCFCQIKRATARWCCADFTSKILPVDFGYANKIHKWLPVMCKIYLIYKKKRAINIKKNFVMVLFHISIGS